MDAALKPKNQKRIENLMKAFEKNVQTPFSEGGGSVQNLHS